MITAQLEPEGEIALIKQWSGKIFPPEDLAAAASSRSQTAVTARIICGIRPGSLNYRGYGPARRTFRQTQKKKRRPLGGGVSICLRLA